LLGSITISLIGGSTSGISLGTTSVNSSSKGYTFGGNLFISAFFSKIRRA